MMCQTGTNVDPSNCDKISDGQLSNMEQNVDPSNSDKISDGLVSNVEQMWNHERIHQIVIKFQMA